MVKAIKKSKKRRRKNALLLRARLVNRQGALLRPSDVQSLHFAIAVVGRVNDDVQPIAIAALDSSEVVLDGLRNDNDWSVDACGYNFCHCIDGSEFDSTFPPKRCEFRYLIRDTSDQISVVRFQIGATDDRN
jgi:hypothetical protein